MLSKFGGHIAGALAIGAGAITGQAQSTEQPPSPAPLVEQASDTEITAQIFTAKDFAKPPSPAALELLMKKGNLEKSTQEERMRRLSEVRREPPLPEPLRQKIFDEIGENYRAFLESKKMAAIEDAEKVDIKPEAAKKFAQKLINQYKIEAQTLKEAPQSVKNTSVAGMLHHILSAYITGEHQAAQEMTKTLEQLANSGSLGKLDKQRAQNFLQNEEIIKGLIGDLSDKLHQIDQNPRKGAFGEYSSMLDHMAQISSIVNGTNLTGDIYSRPFEAHWVGLGMAMGEEVGMEIAEKPKNYRDFGAPSTNSYR